MVSTFPRSASKNDGGEQKIMVRRKVSPFREKTLKRSEYFRLNANIENEIVRIKIRLIPSVSVVLDLIPKNCAISNHTFG